MRDQMNKQWKETKQSREKKSEDGWGGGEEGVLLSKTCNVASSKEQDAILKIFQQIRNNKLENKKYKKFQQIRNKKYDNTPKKT